MEGKVGQVNGGYVTEGHLGGYIKGGDPATQSPILWEWLVKHALADTGGGMVHTVLDVGCGEGHALDVFHRLGCAALGVDGIAQDRADVVQHDYTTGPAPIKRQWFDLVWCCEFVEHVEEKYLPNVMLSLAMGRLVAMTHAFPGQAGYHHVNCQTQDYWVGAMAAYGHRLDPIRTAVARAIAKTSEDPAFPSHFARSGLIFEVNQ